MADKKISQLTGATTPVAGTEVLPIVQGGSTVKVSIDNVTAGRAVNGLSFTATKTGNDAFIKVQNSGAGAAGAWFFHDSQDSQWMGTILQSAGVEKWFAGSYGTSAYHIKNGGRSGTEAFRIETSNDVKVSAGNLVVGTAGKGIDFSANTHAAGMTSELLNWYEQGTFTPVVIGTSTAGTGTYSRQVGRYTRIGNRVLFNIALEWSAHTGSGDMQVDGLPFTSNSTTGNFHAATAFYSNITLTAGNVLILGIGNNSTKIDFQQTPTGGGASTLVALDVAASIIISGHYEV